jgi:hypothetical protein
VKYQRIAMAICLLASFGLAGCADPLLKHVAKIFPQPPLAPSPLPEVKDVAAHVQAAAISDSQAATAIRSNATEGKTRTPPDDAPILDQFWDAILSGADQVHATAQDLTALHQRMDDLAAKVAAKDAQTAALQTALNSANAAIQDEHAARLKAQQAEAQAKSDQAVRLEKLLFGVAITSLLGLGVSVTLGLLMHDIRIGVAGSAGCLAIAIGCFLLGEVIHYRFWILSALGIITLALATYEFLVHRQSILAALKNIPPPKPV